MSCMTGNELISYTREFIHESVAEFWTPTRLLASMNVSMKQIVLKMQRMADRVFYTSATIPTVANQQSYDLPDGSLYSAAPICTGVVDHIIRPDSTPLRKGDFRRYHQGESGTPASFVIVAKKFYLYPIPDSAENLTAWYPYFPAAITASDTAIDFIEGFEELIALECARKSLIKDEADLQDIRYEIAEKWALFRETYCGSRHVGEPDEIPEDINDYDD